jgi:hypothetical protein
LHDGRRSFESRLEADRISAEVRPDQPSTPDTGPIRKKKLKIASLLGSFIILLVLGYAANQTHRTNRNQKVVTEFLVWTTQLEKDNPAVIRGEFMAMTNDFGAAFHYEGKYTTPADRTIAIEFRHSERLFNRSGRLVFSTEGRSVTWPVEDIERGREIDLKAEFPEAFR